jgi:hypothetical protein
MQCIGRRKCLDRKGALVGPEPQLPPFDPGKAAPLPFEAEVRASIEWGAMTGVTRAPRNMAHRIIEEFMLAANEAVAGSGAISLYRMCENVHEWCSDWYDAAYYSVSPSENPQGPAHGKRRSSRGGAWRHHVKF